MSTVPEIMEKLITHERRYLLADKRTKEYLEEIKSDVAFDGFGEEEYERLLNYHSEMIDALIDINVDRHNIILQMRNDLGIMAGALHVYTLAYGNSVSVKSELVQPMPIANMKVEIIPNSDTGLTDVTVTYRDEVENERPE